MTYESWFREVNSRIVACRRCPRLVEWRETVAQERKKAFREWTYWGKPVPLFGDPDADRLILGLAPAAHGANRTGRMFTGDRSGDWLYRALYKAGVASQPESTAAEDGLVLRGAMIAAVCHCAPPENKPLPDEIANCAAFGREVLISRRWKAVLCLGAVAWNHAHRLLGEKPGAFGHGTTNRVGAGPVLVGCYHPSQQNTFTGKLTESMLDAAVKAWVEAS
jgi:uracil-DNA glycosylase family 4